MAARAPAGRRGRAAADRRRHPARLVRHRLPGGRRQARARLAGRARRARTRRRCGSRRSAGTGRPRASSPSRRSARTRAARSRSTGSRSTSRRRRRRASPARATTPSSTRARGGTVVAGPAGRAAPAAAARDRPGRASCAPPAGSQGRSARPGGACASERARRPALLRRARVDQPAAAQGAALRLPRPLVVHAGRARAVRVHRPRRDGHLPRPVLRAEPATRRSTTARTRRCGAARSPRPTQSRCGSPSRSRRAC